MVQLFQRYVPYSSIVDFLVQSLLCMTAFTLVVQVAWWTHFDPTLPHLPGVRFGRTLSSVAVLVLVFYLTGYFERRHHTNTSMYLPRLMQATGLGAVTLGLLYQFVPAIALGWQVTVGSLGLMSIFMLSWHVAAPAVVNGAALAENVLILGEGALAAQLAEKIRTVAPWGFHLAGYIPVADPSAPDTDPDGGKSIGGSPSASGLRACAEPGNPAHARILPFPVPNTLDAPSLGRLQDLELILHRHEIQTIVVALADRRGKLPLATLISAKLRGVAVFEAVEFYERLTGRMMVARMRPSTIIFSDGFAPTRATEVSKRILDVVAAFVLLLLAAPLQLALAAAIRLTSKGPALFRQERVGLNGVPFTMLKFRSMRQDAEKDGPVWAAQNDDRVTPLGRFIRKVRLDELPQLWNIFRGQMSFVGPRPERPVFVRELRAQIPYYEQRHSVRPGLTGWAQVKYPYGASVEETLEKLEYDLYYIKRLSLSFDLTILIETVRVMFTGKGAR
jgi:lipopolysaccharide/colanic/teichoic acid biosynthesis glycosyltransferase